MKKTWIAGLLIMSAIASQSQTLVTQVKPAGSKVWGYANIKGDLIIPAQYEKCYRFSAEGLATIYDQKERQYHFINLKNERLPVEVSEFKIRDGMGFDVQGFCDGMAMVKLGEKWGYINTAGKVVIAAKYDDATDFSSGYANAKIGKKFIILNTKGEEIEVESDVIDVRDFSEKLAPFRASNKKFGFLGTDGKIAIKALYESVGYFSDGLAWAKDGDLLGYINTKGEWVIKPQFTGGKEFDKTSGLARVKNGDKWAYVNKSGQLMYMTDTDTWGDFSEGLADGKKDKKIGFFNSKGEWAIQPQFDGVRDFKNGYAAAKMGDKWGIIDKQGKWVIQPTFDGIKDMEAVR